MAKRSGTANWVMANLFPDNEPKKVRLVTGGPKGGSDRETGTVADPDSYELGYREGASSVVADVRDQFTEYAGTMDELLEFFRRFTGDPELEWPEVGER